MSMARALACSFGPTKLFAPFLTLAAGLGLCCSGGSTGSCLAHLTATRTEPLCAWMLTAVQTSGTVGTEPFIGRQHWFPEDSRDRAPGLPFRSTGERTEKH
jgi:hypothetical protein